MPFQVTLINVTSQVAPPITLLSAGDDQFHVCTSVITLAATIVGDTTGHTFLWEQLEGSLVVLNTPNAISTTFTAGDSTDKLFRFWIDKGLPSQQFEDMWIRKTPFSNIGFGADISRIAFGIDADPVACDDIIATVIITAPPPSDIGPGEESLGPVFTVPLEWQPPDNTNYPYMTGYLYQYAIVENGTIVKLVPDPAPSSAGDVGSGPPAGPLDYDGILGVYRIDSYYKVSEMDFVRESCEKDFSALVVPEVKIINDHMGFAVDTSDQTGIGIKGHGFLRIDYTFARNDSDDNISFGADVPAINIIRFDQQGIGS